MVKLAEAWGKRKFHKGFTLFLGRNSGMVNNNIGKAEELNNYSWSGFGEEPYDIQISYDDDDEIHSFTTSTEEDVKQKRMKLAISRSR